MKYKENINKAELESVDKDLLSVAVYAATQAERYIAMIDADYMVSNLTNLLSVAFSEYAIVETPENIKYVLWILDKFWIHGDIIRTECFSDDKSFEYSEQWVDLMKPFMLRGMHVEDIYQVTLNKLCEINKLDIHSDLVKTVVACTADNWEHGKTLEKLITNEDISKFHFIIPKVGGAKNPDHFCCLHCGCENQHKTSHCCGRELTKQELEDIIDGRLDFVDRGWILTDKELNNRGLEKVSEDDLKKMVIPGVNFAGNIKDALPADVNEYMNNLVKGSSNTLESERISLKTMSTNSMNVFDDLEYAKSDAEFTTGLYEANKYINYQHVKYYRSNYLAVAEDLIPSDFMRKVIGALGLNIPVFKIKDYKYIEDAIIERILGYKKDSIIKSWQDNPEQMGK